MPAESSGERVFHATTSLCTVCKRGIPAELLEREGRILMRKTCPEHGARDVLVASDAAWYRDAMGMPAVLAAPAARHEVEQGCPYDCGPCASHEQKSYLPVIPITSACNLDCPICYTINKNDGAYHIALDEFARILEVIRKNDPEMKIINLTGGEPTLHPELPRIIRMCHDAGIHRVTISTHGLTFINHPELLMELKALRARIVLSFNSFEEAVNDKMLGAKVFKAKMRVLEQLAEHKVDTTLIPVLAAGYNDHEVGRILEMALREDFLRSLEIHTMTFTGQGGRGFDEAARLTPPDVMRRVAEGSGGRIAMSDFVPSPCAHPLCYQTCYLLDVGERDWVPFARFMTRAQVRELLTDNLYMEPGPRLERVLQGVIDEMWAAETPPPRSEAILAALKRLLVTMFPAQAISYPEQQAIAERAAKTVYIHSHMDDESFDTDRIRQCCVGVPDAAGGNIPTCAYNILYRGRDKRFSAADLAPLAELPGGRRFDGLTV